MIVDFTVFIIGSHPSLIRGSRYIKCPSLRGINNNNGIQSVKMTVKTAKRLIISAPLHASISIGIDSKIIIKDIGDLGKIQI